MADRLHLTDQIYVELLPDRTVVSWPGGHRVVDADGTLRDLLGLLSMAIKDTYEPRAHVPYPKRLMPPCPAESES